MEWHLLCSGTRSRIARATCAAVFLMLAGSWLPFLPISRAHASDLPPYRFGVLPLQSPNKLASMFLPLTKVLEHSLHRPVQFVTAPSFSVFMQRVARREYDIVYLNPLLCAEAQKSGYHVIAKIAGEPFTGILVVRRDSNITKLAAPLQPGLRLGFPDPGAFAATVMTRRYMESLGIPVDRDFEVKYFGSQDSVLMALYSGLVDVAGTWKPSLRSMPKHIQQALRIIAETPPEPQMPIAVRDDMPVADMKMVAKVLVDMGSTIAGRQILNGMELPQGFVLTDDSEYAKVGK